MNIQFTTHGWKDYLYWQAKDKAVVKRINQLIKDITRSPYEGIGKPEPLKFDLMGLWSRRITKEHRAGLYGPGGCADRFTVPLSL